MKKGNTLVNGCCRLSISIPTERKVQLDQMIREKGYENRSGLMGDLIQAEWIQHRSRHEDVEIAGTITLLYDHHSRLLQTKLTDIQHEAEATIISVLHVHLDHHHCMEVLAVKGPAKEVQYLADRLIATRGVMHGQLMIMSSSRLSHSRTSHAKKPRNKAKK